MTREDYGMAPLVAAEGIHFFIPSTGPNERPNPSLRSRRSTRSSDASPRCTIRDATPSGQWRRSKRPGRLRGRKLRAGQAEACGGSFDGSSGNDRCYWPGLPVTASVAATLLSPVVTISSN